MSKCLVSSSIVGALLSFAVPAFANHFDAVISGDCTGFQAHITGASYIAFTAQYQFQIASESGQPIAVEGSIVIPPANPVDVTISDTWDGVPCGASVVTGAIHIATDQIQSDGTPYPSFDFTYESAALDCACGEHPIRLAATTTADCTGYQVHITGTSTVAYTAAFSFQVASESGEPIVATGSTEIAAAEAIDFTFGDSWKGVPCGAATVTGEIHLTTAAVPPEGTTYPAFDFTYEASLDCPCDEGSPGTGTPGFWKNHPDAWPVDEIEVGCVTYSKDDAIALLLQADGGDKLRTMFRSLIAAKLNVLIGNDDSCIADTIDAADAWMCQYGPLGKTVVVAGKKSPWRTGEALYLKLDAYNNGLLCAPHRD